MFCNILEWNKLSQDTKKHLVSDIFSSKDIDAKFKNFETFHQNGITLKTPIFEYNSSEYVFVPGAENITLGWDINKLGFEENILSGFKEDWSYLIAEAKSDYLGSKKFFGEKIKKSIALGNKSETETLENEFQEILEDITQEMNLSFDKYMEQLYNYTKNIFSPIRSVNINPMIVERDYFCLEKDMTYNEFIENLSNTSFSIPTEDEWEYLCGGGTRTFFRWGDFLDNTIFDRFHEITKKSIPVTSPNMFGLYISYSSYKYELIKDSLYCKASDGGYTACHDYGLRYTAPIYSTFYRVKRNNFPELFKSFYAFRKILRK